MKLYKSPTNDYIYLQNSEIYNYYSIRWYCGYFAFYFPVENKYDENDIYVFTHDKKRAEKTSKYFSTFLKRLKDEIVQTQ